jgi:VWFA-related protein
LRLVAALVILLLCLATATANAAGPSTLVLTSVEEQPGRLAVRFNALDAEGQPLLGLTAANFRAYLGETPLPVSDLQTLSRVRIPTSVVLLVDVSGSMQGASMDQAKRSMLDFLRSLDPRDPVALISFSTAVEAVQPFTTDRAAVTATINALKPAGDTALYDAVLEAANIQVASGSARKLVLLITDGEATVGLERRQESLDAAAGSGANFLAVGLGAAIDRSYLVDLASRSGGRFLEVANSSLLSRAYTDIAASLQNQYTLLLGVPSSIDRSLPAALRVQMSFRGETVFAERPLGPLAGARAQPFDLSVDGLKSNQKLSAPLALEPLAGEAQITAVTYAVDGVTVHTAATAPWGFLLDPSLAAPGRHLLSVVAIDSRGRRGEAQIPFTSVAASSSGGSSFPLQLVLGGLLVCLAAGAYLFLRRRAAALHRPEHRIQPFARRITEPLGPVEGWMVPRPRPMPARKQDRPLARLVVMNEAAVKAGSLDAIREYELYSAPLLLGCAGHCDICLEDGYGRIGTEEARIWVQKDRLVYHKLTTLSAMATEGITAGWVFLENGEDMSLGPYRLIFQALDQSEEEEPAPPESQDETEPGLPLWRQRPDNLSQSV